MQIRDIILYGEDSRIRRLSFKIGDVNIITGASGTGKSAVHQIVEYILGRDKFIVPAGPISRAVYWYGLCLQFPETQVFVARRAPDAWQKITGDTYFEIGHEIDIPPQSKLIPNVNPKDLNQYLTRLLQVSPNLHIPDDDQTRRPLEGTLRHALFFSFQTQTEIAKNTILFHRQDEQYIPQAISDILPYFLGAIDEKRVVTTQNLRKLKRDLSLAERKSKEISDIAGKGLNRGLALLSEAQSIGLIPLLDTTPSNVDELRNALSPALSWTPQDNLFMPNDVVTSLQSEYDELMNAYRRCRDSINSARYCEEGQKGFLLEANEQKARLAFVNIYPGDSDTTCPLCQSELPTPIPSVNQISQSLKRISDQLDEVSTENPRLREFIDQQESQSTTLKQRINQLRSQMRSASMQSPEIQNFIIANSQYSEIKGKISLYMESLNENNTNVENIQKEPNIEILREEIRSIEDELSENYEDILPSILNIINKYISENAQSLNLEYSDLPLRLDIKNLAIVADDPENGPVPLFRIGSGANWVGYHLATYLALHEWFILRKRPVPNFLFLDQPTQVYFPRDRDSDMKGSTAALVDDDQIVVRRMFKWLIDKVQKLAPNLQIIVLEHADLLEDWYQDRVIYRWRDGEKLVPLDWIDSDEETINLPLESISAEHGLQDNLFDDF
jgi:hypothetical protein